MFVELVFDILFCILFIFMVIPTELAEWCILNTVVGNILWGSRRMLSLRNDHTIFAF